MRICTSIGSDKGDFLVDAVSRPYSHSPLGARSANKTFCSDSITKTTKELLRLFAIVINTEVFEAKVTQII